MHYISRTAYARQSLSNAADCSRYAYLLRTCVFARETHSLHMLLALEQVVASENDILHKNKRFQWKACTSAGAKLPNINRQFKFTGPPQAWVYPGENPGGGGCSRVQRPCDQVEPAL